MKYIIDEKEKVLHIIYEEKERNGKEFENIYNISKIHEGVEIPISTIAGLNFPMKTVPKKNLLRKYEKDCDYVIVYKKGDKITKLHELCHAKYDMNMEYKKSCVELWNFLDKTSKKNVKKMLEKMKYNVNNLEIVMDEFQAYFHTEKPNFFGKLVFL